MSLIVIYYERERGRERERTRERESDRVCVLRPN
jgi:hypothetical protein